MAGQRDVNFSYNKDRETKTDKPGKLKKPLSKREGQTNEKDA